MKKQILEEKKEYLEQLFDLLKIPSISADPKYNEAVKKTANWIEGALKKIGCNNVEVFETAGHPIVYGEKFININAPTVLVYGHYDVQPPDPLELWETILSNHQLKKLNSTLMAQYLLVVHVMTKGKCLCILKQ